MTAPTISTATANIVYAATTRRSNDCNNNKNNNNNSSNNSNNSHHANNHKSGSGKVTSASAAVASALNAVNAAMNSIEGGSKKLPSPSRAHSSPAAAAPAGPVDSDGRYDGSRPPVKINLVRRSRSSSFQIHDQDTAAAAAAANEQLEKLLAMVDHHDDEDETRLQAKTNLKNLLLQRIVHRRPRQPGHDDSKALLDSSESNRSVNSLSLHREIELPLENPFRNFHAHPAHPEKPDFSDSQPQPQPLQRSHLRQDEQPPPVLKRVSSFLRQDSHRKFTPPEEFDADTSQRLDDSIKRVSFQGDHYDRDDYGFSRDRSFSDGSSSDDYRGQEDEFEVEEEKEEEEEKKEEAFNGSSSSLLYSSTIDEGTAIAKDSFQDRVSSFQASCPNFSSSSKIPSNENCDEDNYSKGILKHSSRSGRTVGVATKGILKRSQFNRRSSVDHPMITTQTGNGGNDHPPSSRHRNCALEESSGRKQEDLASSMPNLNSHTSWSAPFKRPVFRKPLSADHLNSDSKEECNSKYNDDDHKKKERDIPRGSVVAKDEWETQQEEDDDLGMSMESLISADSSKTRDSANSDSLDRNRTHKESWNPSKSHRISRSSSTRHRSNSTGSQSSDVPFKDEIFVPLKIISPRDRRDGTNHHRSGDNGSGSGSGSGGDAKHQDQKQRGDKPQSHRTPSRSRNQRHRSVSDADGAEKKTRSSHSSGADGANASKEEIIATIKKSKSFVINHHRVGATAVNSDGDGLGTGNTAGNGEVVRMKRSKSFFNHHQDDTASSANNDVAGCATKENFTIKKSTSFYNRHRDEIAAHHDDEDANDTNPEDMITIKKSKSFINRPPPNTGKSKETNNVPLSDANEDAITVKKSKSFVDRRSPTPAAKNHDSDSRRHSSRPRSRGRHHHGRSQAEEDEREQRRRDGNDDYDNKNNNNQTKKEKSKSSKTSSSSKDKRPSHRHRRSSTGAIDDADHEHHREQVESSYNRRSSADNPIPRRTVRDTTFTAPPPPPPPPPRKSSRKSSSGKHSSKTSPRYSSSAIQPPPPPPPHPSNTSLATAASSSSLLHRRSSADLLTNQAKQMLDGADFEGFYCVVTSEGGVDTPPIDTPASNKTRSSSRHRARATSHGPVSTVGADVTSKTSIRRGSEHRSKSRSKREVSNLAEGKKKWTPDAINIATTTVATADNNDGSAMATPPAPIISTRSSSSVPRTTKKDQKKSLSPNEAVDADYCSSFRTTETNTTSSSLESFGVQVEESSMY